jgi:7,8-dihydropterin-6-yl-methyl-4-(beta-D-ribofuranosyl)aminobenzene 5'-phosphate synthase
MALSRPLIWSLLVAFVLFLPAGSRAGSLAPPTTAKAATVNDLKITILSTMLADAGFGEWGYAALVETGGKRILFDTGANPETVLKNAEALNIDLSGVEDVVISHNHDDHTGGLLTLRRTLMARNPTAMSRVHVSDNIFLPRFTREGKNANGFTPSLAAYAATGGQVILHHGPAQIAPGVWFTGPVPRRYPETNWSTEDLHLETPSGAATDNVPEDAALVFATPEGAAVLTGCGHTGIINIASYAKQILRLHSVTAVIGGLHLFAKPLATVDWTGHQLKKMGVRYLLAGHCTGIEATFRLRRDLGLTKATAPVSAVGSSFTLGKGISAGDIAG